MYFGVSIISLNLVPLDPRSPARVALQFTLRSIDVRLYWFAFVELRQGSNPLGFAIAFTFRGSLVLNLLFA